MKQPHLTPSSSHGSIEKEHSSPAEEKGNSDYDPVNVVSGNGGKIMTSNNVTVHSATCNDTKPNVSGLKNSIPTPLATIGPGTNIRTSKPELTPSPPTDTSPSKQHEESTTQHTNGSTSNKPQTSHADCHGSPPPLKPKPILHKKKLPDVHSSEDVAKLSIDEVGEYLKHLKLEQYVAVFKSSMIDGQLLMDVTKEMLIDEFHFKQSEVLRLIAFAKKGHVPL